MINNDTEIYSVDNEDITNKDRYIVMELLKPMVTENILITQKSQHILAKTNCSIKTSRINNELGTFGVLVKYVPFFVLYFA